MSRTRGLASNWLLILGMFTLLGTTCVQGIRSGMAYSVPELPFQRTAMACAISRLVYGMGSFRDTYTAYSVVEEKLKEGGYISDYDPLYPQVAARLGISDSLKLHRDARIQERALQEAAHIQGKFDRSDRNRIIGDTKGVVIYYLLAFLLFGIHVSSPYLFFFALVGASLLAFSVAFHKERLPLILGFFFCVALYVVTMAIPGLGIQIITVHNYRFLPVIAMIPGLHLFLLMARNVCKTRIHVALAAFQGLLVIFAYHIRDTALWIPLLFALCLGVIFLVRIKPRWLPGRAQIRLTMWPAILILCLLGGFKIYERVAYFRVYSPADSHHLFWHNLYLGFCNDPEMHCPAGISDEAGDLAARNYIREHSGHDPGPLAWTNNSLYERTIRTVYFRTWETEPLFAIEAHILKIRTFLRNFFEFYLSRTLFLTLFLGATVGILYRPNRYGKGPILGLLIGFCFSFMINLLAYARSFVISEPSFMATATLGFCIAYFFGGLSDKISARLNASGGA